MIDKKTKRIPYGVANYELIAQNNRYYVDKTMYLKTIEESDNYLFFVRPRRFGKSLFLSVMEAYYDVFYKDRFEEFFRGTWIFDHPTEERGKYLMLSLNFSVVEPDPAKIEKSFSNHVRGRAVNFIQKYGKQLSAYPKKDYFEKKIENSQSAAGVLSTLLMLCEGAQQDLYVIIDEYDNFANTILSTVGEGAYRDMAHGLDFFRSFFNALKEGTTGTGAPVTRSFITGVSPVTMDDVTSSYNIGSNVSLNPAFNRMLGFTKNDVVEMIEYYRSAGLIEDSTTVLLDIMGQWYDNYLFSEEDGVRLFNSDMVLYFINNYLSRKKLPDDLIDRNVRVDYGKLKHLIIADKMMGKGKIPNGNFKRLKEIIENGETSAKITTGFPMEKLADENNFISLLFYFGLLTVKNVELDEFTLTIPNETIRRLYYDYIKRAYRETGIFNLDLDRYGDLMTDMAYDGKWRPLLEFITGRMVESMSLRDLITGEKSIQAFLNVYLGLTDLYIIHTDKVGQKLFIRNEFVIVPAAKRLIAPPREWGADIVMEPFLARYEGIRYAYILEIKYIKAGVSPKDEKVRRLKAQAEEQLKHYSIDKKFSKVIAKTELIKIALVFSGHERVAMSAVNE